MFGIIDRHDEQRQLTDWIIKWLKTFECRVFECVNLYLSLKYKKIRQPIKTKALL